jgi:flavin-binding protein dodecin
MSTTVAKVIELTSSSTQSFDDAVRGGIERACKTLQNVTGAWVKDHEVEIKNGQITGYRVRLHVTFILNE